MQNSILGHYGKRKYEYLFDYLWDYVYSLGVELFFHEHASSL